MKPCTTGRRRGRPSLRAAAPSVSQDRSSQALRERHGKLVEASRRDEQLAELEHEFALRERCVKLLGPVARRQGVAGEIPVDRAHGLALRFLLLDGTDAGVQ
jgi:hypothetical protein